MMTSPTMFQNTFNELFAGNILWSLENVILKVLFNIFVFEKLIISIQYALMVEEYFFITWFFYGFLTILMVKIKTKVFNLFIRLYVLSADKIKYIIFYTTKQNLRVFCTTRDFIKIYLSIIVILPQYLTCSNVYQIK